jgi:outer membrane lipoprotein carrier protein
MFRFLLLLAFAAHNAWAATTAQLRDILDDTHSLRGSFNQTVTDRNGRKLQTSTGTLSFVRPGMFRWEYEKPYPQTVVGDGKKVWFYDPDLEQVTVQRMSRAIGASPAALLAGSNDIDRHFKVSEAGHSNGLDWLEAVPRQGEGTFEKVRIGFRGQLIEVMELKDNLGQTSVLRFSRLSRNLAVPAEHFQFTPPKGAQVVEAR